MLKRHKYTVTVSLRSPIFKESQAVWDEFQTITVKQSLIYYLCQ